MPTDEQFGAFLEGEDGALSDGEHRQLGHLRALLGDGVVWEAPPEVLEDEVVRQIVEVAAPNVASLSGHRRRPRRSLASRSIAFAAGVAAALAVVVAVGLFRGGDGYSVEIAGTELAQLATGIVTIENTPSGVSIELDVEGLPPAPEGFYYQAWMKGESGAVTVGTFHARADGSDIVLWSGVSIANYPTLTVTIQEEGAGAESSGQLVMTADLTQP